MASGMSSNLCRLCLGTNDLLWVFDNKVADDMAQIIHTTSGVLISSTDAVSQMVCSTCCQLTIKINQFRTTSMCNDIDLKASHADYIAELTTDAVLKEAAVTVAPRTPPPSKTHQIIHPSVQEVMDKYPDIKMPNNCLKSHIGAYIILYTDEVNKWYIDQGYNEEDIEKSIKDASEALSDEKLTPVEAKGDDNKRKSTIKKRKISVETENCSGKKRRNNVSEGVEETVKTLCDRGVNLRVDKRKAIATTEPIHISEKNTKNNDCDGVVKSVISNKVNAKTVNEASPKKTASEERQSRKIKESIANKPTQVDKSPRKQELKEINSDNLHLTFGEVIEKALGKDEKRSEMPIRKQDESPLTKELSPAVNKSAITLRSLKETSQPIDLMSINNDADGDADIQIVCDEDTTVPKSNNKTNNAVEKSNIRDSNWVFFANLPNSIGCPSEPILLSDSDAEDSTSSNADSGPADKIPFIEALNLTPIENIPDLSLVLVAPRSYKLYTCRVCDSQHSNLKDLKQHERRTHTKCPFCNKKCRTLANRNNHLATCVMRYKNLIQMKSLRLELVKVDTIPEMRQKYASAFERRNCQEPENNPTRHTRSKKNTTQSEDSKNSSLQHDESEKNLEKYDDRKSTILLEESHQKENQSAQVSTPKGCDATTIDVINELETFLNLTETVSDYQTETINHAKDVNCIKSTDEEITEDESNIVRKINVINCEMLDNISMHDNDEFILQQIITKHQVKSWEFSGPILSSGPTNCCKVYKNLCKELRKHNILVDIQHSPVVTVQYQQRTPQKTTNSLNLWYNLKPKELDLINIQPSPIPYSPFILSTISCTYSPVPKPVPATSNCSLSPTFPSVLTSELIDTKQAMVPSQNHITNQSESSASTVMSPPTDINKSSDAVILVTPKMLSVSVIIDASGASHLEKTLDNNLVKLAPIAESLMPSSTIDEHATSTNVADKSAYNVVISRIDNCIYG